MLRQPRYAPRHLGLEANGIAHHAPRLAAATFTRHALRQRNGGDATGLRHHDRALAAPPRRAHVLEQILRHLGRLAAARLSRDDHDSRLAQCVEELSARTVRGQPAACFVGTAVQLLLLRKKRGARPFACITRRVYRLRLTAEARAPLTARAPRAPLLGAAATAWRAGTSADGGKRRRSFGQVAHAHAALTHTVAHVLHGGLGLAGRFTAVSRHRRCLER